VQTQLAVTAFDSIDRKWSQDCEEVRHCWGPPSPANADAADAMRSPPLARKTSLPPYAAMPYRG